MKNNCYVIELCLNLFKVPFYFDEYTYSETFWVLHFEISIFENR